MPIDMKEMIAQAAKRLLEGNRGKLEELARFLYEKETITGDEFMSILQAGGEQA